MKLSPDILRELLNYDASTGVLRWRAREPEMFKGSRFGRPEAVCVSWNKQNAGRPALNTSDAEGYRHGTIFGRQYKAHRVAFCLEYGRWPSRIDHINGDKADNRLDNLREVTASENSRNRALNTNNASGVHGVDWVPARGKWRARILKQHLGYFDTREAAEAARREAEAGAQFHENHGRKVDA